MSDWDPEAEHKGRKVKSSIYYIKTTLNSLQLEDMTGRNIQQQQTWIWQCEGRMSPIQIGYRLISGMNTGELMGEWRQV